MGDEREGGGEAGRVAGHTLTARAHSPLGWWCGHGATRYSAAPASRGRLFVASIPK